jgi:hypothetical protein
MCGGPREPDGRSRAARRGAGDRPFARLASPCAASAPSLPGAANRVGVSRGTPRHPKARRSGAWLHQRSMATDEKSRVHPPWPIARAGIVGYPGSFPGAWRSGKSENGRFFHGRETAKQSRFNRGGRRISTDTPFGLKLEADRPQNKSALHRTTQRRARHRRTTAGPLADAAIQRDRPPGCSIQFTS